MRRLRTHRISISNNYPRRILLKPIRRAISELMTAYNVPPTEISILLTDDAEMRRLNREYRKIDSTTDVLTFPSGSMPGAGLGDIVISVPVAQAQADSRSIPLSTELSFLAIHGGLHLLGFDDRTENERRDMLKRMNEVALSSGLPLDPDWSSLPHG